MIILYDTLLLFLKIQADIYIFILYKQSICIFIYNHKLSKRVIFIQEMYIQFTSILLYLMHIIYIAVHVQSWWFKTNFNFLVNCQKYKLICTCDAL